MGLQRCEPLELTNPSKQPFPERRIQCCDTPAWLTRRRVTFLLQHNRLINIQVVTDLDPASQNGLKPTIVARTAN